MCASTRGRSKRCTPSRMDEAFTRDGLDLRAEARWLSPDREQIEGRSAAADPERQRLHGSLSGSRARGESTAVSMNASSTAKSSCPTRKGCRAFRCSSSRGRLSSSLEIRRAAVELPATFYAFDLIAFEDFDLRSAAAHRAQAVPRSTSFRSSDRCATRSHRARGRSVPRAGDRDGARGNRRQEGRLAVFKGPQSVSGSRSRRSRQLIS